MAKTADDMLDVGTNSIIYSLEWTGSTQNADIKKGRLSEDG